MEWNMSQEPKKLDTSHISFLSLFRIHLLLPVYFLSHSFFHPFYSFLHPRNSPLPSFHQYNWAVVRSLSFFTPSLTLQIIHPRKILSHFFVRTIFSFSFSLSLSSLCFFSTRFPVIPLFISCILSLYPDYLFISCSLQRINNIMILVKELETTFSFHQKMILRERLKKSRKWKGREIDLSIPSIHSSWTWKEGGASNSEEMNEWLVTNFRNFSLSLPPSLSLYLLRTK